VEIKVSTSEMRENSTFAKALPLLEATVFIGVFVADHYHLVPLSKTPFLLAIGWMSLRLRGARWRDVGLEAPSNWSRVLVLGLIVGVGMEALELLVTQPMLASLVGAPPDFSDYDRLRGNAKLLVFGIGFAWTFAAFGEEMVWRGYVLNRLALARLGTPARWIVSLVVTSTCFGIAHANQGLTGVIDESLMGAILGLLYLLCGRGLMVPIIAHGAADTIDAILLFTGHYPRS
jgi:membrane protease YdiL (CAAX protease family)